MNQEQSNKKNIGIRYLVKMLWDVLSDEIKSQKALLIISFVLTIFTTIAAFMGTFFLEKLIDKGIQEKDADMLIRYGSFIIGSYGIGFVIWFGQVFSSVRASENIFYKLRVRLFDAIFNKPTRFFAEYHSGDIMTRFTQDIDSLAGFFYQTVIQTLAMVVFCFLLMVALISWQWQLGIISLISLLPFIIFLLLSLGVISKKSKTARETLSSQNDHLLDAFSGHREIQFLRQQKKFHSIFSKVARAYTKATINLNTLTGMTKVSISLFATLVSLIPYFIGGYMICKTNQAITTGLLVAYAELLAMLTMHIVVIFMGIVKLAEILPVTQRIKQILDYPEIPEPKITGTGGIPDSTKFEFKNVSFNYNPTNPILENFNLTIQPNEKIAIMGASGSGKSTLASLLLRFLKPTSGEIMLAGKNIHNYSLPFYLHYFAYMRQETHLFKASVLDNIGLGWSGVDLKKARQVCTLAGIDETINRLPDGYDTIIGTNGVSFSGGQQQRLALARALVRDPKILLLDEFTSALDTETENGILSNIFEVFNDATIICVTHSHHLAEHFERTIKI